MFLFVHLCLFLFKKNKKENLKWLLTMDVSAAIFLSKPLKINDILRGQLNVEQMINEF